LLRFRTAIRHFGIGRENARIEPDVGSVRPRIMFMAVVFPAPFTPRRPRISPR